MIDVQRWDEHRAKCYDMALVQWNIAAATSGAKVTLKDVVAHLMYDPDRDGVKTVKDREREQELNVERDIFNQLMEMQRTLKK